MNVVISMRVSVISLRRNLAPCFITLCRPVYSCTFNITRFSREEPGKGVLNFGVHDLIVL